MDAKTTPTNTNAKIMVLTPNCDCYNCQRDALWFYCDRLDARHVATYDTHHNGMASKADADYVKSLHPGMDLIY